MSDSTLGMIFMALAMLLLPIGDTFAKVLTADLHPAEVTLARLLASKASCIRSAPPVTSWRSPST